jgi:hypothetical protein
MNDIAERLKMTENFLITRYVNGINFYYDNYTIVNTKSTKRTWKRNPFDGEHFTHGEDALLVCKAFRMRHVSIVKIRLHWDTKSFTILQFYDMS